MSAGINFFQYHELLEFGREPVDYVTSTTVCGGTKWHWIDAYIGDKKHELLPAVSVDISKIL
jgi:hypothetical protein